MPCFSHPHPIIIIHHPATLITNTRTYTLLPHTTHHNSNLTHSPALVLFFSPHPPCIHSETCPFVYHPILSGISDSTQVNPLLHSTSANYFSVLGTLPILPQPRRFFFLNPIPSTPIISHSALRGTPWPIGGASSGNAECECSSPDGEPGQPVEAHNFRAKSSTDVLSPAAGALPQPHLFIHESTATFQ